MMLFRQLAISSVQLALTTTLAGNALAADTSAASQIAPALDVNNQWSVNVGNSIKVSQEWFYVAIKRVENHWEIQKIYDRAPLIDRSQPVELFAATRDFQQWTNVYLEMRTDCDKFEVRESDAHSVCTSSLAEKKPGLGMVGLLFGGSGGAPFAYTDDKVKAAINSIPTQQALVKLTEFEGKSQNAQQQAKAEITQQRVESNKAEEEQVRARKAAPIGAKDWCEQTVKYFGVGMQIESNYTCNTYGVVDEDILRNEGWAITNKQSRKIGHPRQLLTVYSIAIEKVPH